MRSALFVVLAVSVALAFYLPFPSISFDDFDSFNFARALVHFDPAAGNPHSPGYVLYVWLGRVALALTGDARGALTLLSAICAALACGLLVAIVQQLFDTQVALSALALVLLTPLMWLNAGKALSDAPGLLAQAMCVWFIVAAVKRGWPPWIAGLTLGLAAGFRPQGVLGLGLALLVGLWYTRANLAAWIKAGLAATLGVMTWLLPLLAAFHWDVARLRAYLLGATGFVTSQESLFATALSPQSVVARWRDLWFWSSQAVFGPLPALPRTLLFLGMLILVAAACARRRQNIGIWLCIAWLAPQAVLQLLFLNPSLTRYLLAFLFPSAILVAVGLQVTLNGITHQQHWSLLPALGFLCLVGAATWPLVQGLHTQISPPEQLVAYIADRFPAGRTLIIARQSYNALLYHLPGYDVRFLDYYGDAALEELIARGQMDYVVVADPESLRPSEQYVEIESRSFTRDAQIHAKHARVDVNVYGRTEALTLRDFALPEAQAIAIGTPQDAKYLLGGWYRREDIGGVPARWTGAEPQAILRIYLPPGDVAVTLRAVSFAPEQVVELLCNDQPVGKAPVAQNWSEIAFTIPATSRRTDELTYLAICPSVLIAPASDGKSTDHRTLGIAITEIRFASH